MRSFRLVRRLRLAEVALVRAGFRRCPGELGWKPPVNARGGELWRRIVELEKERDELLKEADLLKYASRSELMDMSTRRRFTMMGL